MARRNKNGWALRRKLLCVLFALSAALADARRQLADADGLLQVDPAAVLRVTPLGRPLVLGMPLRPPPPAAAAAAAGAAGAPAHPASDGGGQAYTTSIGFFMATKALGFCCVNTCAKHSGYYKPRVLYPIKASWNRYVCGRVDAQQNIESGGRAGAG